MLDLIRLYLVNILRPIFEDPQLIQDDLLGDVTEFDKESNRQNDYDNDEEQADARSQAISYNGSEWADVQSFRRRKKDPLGSKSSVPARSHSKKPKKKRSISELGFLDSSGPKLMDGARSWLLLFQIIGQVNWLGVPFYLSLIYKTFLFAAAGYIYYSDFLTPLISSNIIDNYRNPIFIFIGLLAVVTTLLHAILSIYSNLSNLCPLFKVLTTQKLCFIKTEVQHIVGSKTLFTMLVFHIYQSVLLQMLGVKDLSEFFNQFQVGRFVLDSFALTCIAYLHTGINHIDFYIRICFGFWIIAMKTNLEYRFAYLERHKRIIRRINFSAATMYPSSQSNQEFVRQPVKDSNLNQVNTQLDDRLEQEQIEEGNQKEFSDNNNRDQVAIEDHCSHNSLEGSATTMNYHQANNSISGTRINHNKRRLATAQSVEQTTLNSFKEKYKIDTLDEIQKNLNTMDDHLEVCRGIQNSSLVLITLNAFLTNGALLLLAYNLLANRGNYYHGVIVVLLAANNTFQVFLCYIGDSWISYALGSFVQTVEDEYFLQGGDDPVTQEPMQTKSETTLDNNRNDAVSPFDWSIIQMNDPSDAGSETAASNELIKQNQSLFLIKKKHVLFCREFLHQFENHLATPWSKLTVKIHLHMLGTFVTLIAAQIIFDREH